MKKLYITSTKQGDGKTMVTLGLMAAFSKRVKEIGFMKPVGLSELKLPDYSIDQDASLIERVFNLHANIRDINPVNLDRDSIDRLSDPAKRGGAATLKKPLCGLKEITDSFARVSVGRDMMIIKGTVGAACGTVYGFSNALVARELGAKVLILTSGGVGHPLDEVVLNLEYFKSHRIEVIGVVFNKVFPQEIDKLRTFGEPFLDRFGTKLLGVIPHVKALAVPTMQDIGELIGGKVLAGERHLGNHASKILVGAMSSGIAASYFMDLEENALLITGGDRTDIILAALVSSLISYGRKVDPPRRVKFAGLLLTCGVEPPEKILELMRRLEVPVISAPQDSYTIVSRISQMQVKISPADKQKIDIVNDAVRRHVELDTIFELL